MTTLHGFPVQFENTLAPYDPVVDFGALGDYQQVRLSSLLELAELLVEKPVAECRASWEANKELSLLRDKDGPCWRPSTEAGEPNRFCGIPIVTDWTLKSGSFEFRDPDGRVVARGSVP